MSEPEQQDRGRVRTGPVAVAALGVLVAHGLLLVIPGLLSLSYSVLQPQAAGPWIGSFVSPFLLEAVPFAVGVFVCLRFMTPISPEQGVLGVILRGVVATVAGAVLVAVAGLVSGRVGVSGSATSIVPVLASAAEVGVRRVFIAVLAAVLLWIRLRAPLLPGRPRGRADEV